MASFNKMVCALCRSTALSLQFTLPEYINHLRLFHVNQPNFSIVCGLDGCLRRFKNLGTFRNHVSAHHTNYFNASSDHDASEISNSLTIDDECDTEDDEDGNDVMYIF